MEWMVKIFNFSESFLPHDARSAKRGTQRYAVLLRPSVCLSVCL